MDSLQGDDKAWMRYYAINFEWIQRWIAYVQCEDKNTAVHPGPVDNESIVQHMINLRSEQDTSPNGQAMFYTVNKHLFHYFISLYGGGPAIIQNQLFTQVECSFMPMRADNETYEGEESKSS